MLNRIFFVLGVGCCLLGGCFESKIDRLRLDILADRLTLLEEWQTEMNGNIRALQLLVEAQKEAVSVVSVTKVADGYTVLLSDRRALHIRNGEKGESGAAATVLLPIVSVRDSSDGHVYWTVNGELLRNIAGKPVRADGAKGDAGETGETGEAGTDGIIPQIRINTDTDMWEISVDGGKIWEPTGVKATGSRGETGDPGPEGPAGSQGPVGAYGEAVFAKGGIGIKEEYAEFTLADREKTKIRIPLYREGALTFPEGMEVRIPAGAQRKVPFVISGAGRAPMVDAAGDNGWLAEVRMDSTYPLQGEVVVTAPAVAGYGSVLVLLSDGGGRCWTYRLKAIAYLTE